MPNIRLEKEARKSRAFQVARYGKNVSEYPILFHGLVNPILTCPIFKEKWNSPFARCLRHY